MKNNKLVQRALDLCWLLYRSIGPLCAAFPEDERAPRWWLTELIKSSDGNVARVSQGCTAGLASLPAEMWAVWRPRRRISPFHQKLRTRGEWMYPVQPHESAVRIDVCSLLPVRSTHSATRGCSNGTENCCSLGSVYIWCGLCTELCHRVA